MSEQNLEISKLNINNTIYKIKDTEARATIEEAQETLKSTIEEQKKLLNKEAEELQEIQGEVAFKQAITLANGATISVDGNTVTFQ